MRVFASSTLLIAFAACSNSEEINPDAPLAAAREPPPAARSIADAIYLQEYNHPLLDDDPRRVPLVSVLVTGAGSEPIFVGPRGIVGSLAIPDEEADLVGAAATANALIAIGPRTVHRFAGGAWTSTTAPLTLRAVSGGRSLAYVITDSGAFAVPEGRTIDWTAPTFPGARVVLELGLDGADTAVATTSSISVFTSGSRAWSAAIPAEVGEPRALIANVTLPRALDLIVVGSVGIAGLIAPGQWIAAPELAANRVPYSGARAAARLEDGGFVIATSNGAMRMIDRGDGPEWRVYNVERWIPSQDVRAIAVEPGVVDGRIWFATALGPAEISARRITLEEKLAPFVERIVARHDRDGAVADSHLVRRGDLSTNIPWDSDNDGSWTSYWLRGECYRWKVTADPEAREHFSKALDAMLRLREVSGREDYLARAVIRKAGCMLDDCDNPDDGQWFTSPDGEWWVKGDTSNDEVIAHIGMMGQAYDLCADEDQKARIRRHISAIIGGIMDNGWQLIDLDGGVTTYGQWDPGYVNESIPGLFGDGGVRSVQILASLSLAHYLTGEQRFLDGKQSLMKLHKYDENTERELEYPVRLQNQDNDEMSVWAWMVLLRYENDDQLHARWLAAWRKNWALKYRDEQGAWWNVVHAYNGGPELELESTLRWLRLAPVDMVRWNVINSNRLDLIPAPEAFGPTARMRSDGRIIPYDERPCDRWNTDQFKVDGGFDGFVEMDGADVLEPYWMARYYGWIRR